MKKELLIWLPAILIMITIFIYSSMPAEESSQKSMKIVDFVIRVYENISDDTFDNTRRLDHIENLEHIIRKSAHVTEYALLAAAIALALWRKVDKGYALFFQAVFLTVVYAATDEFHQRFVPGRSGELKDVLIDSTGAILGALFFLGLSRALKRRGMIKLGTTKPKA